MPYIKREARECYASILRFTLRRLASNGHDPGEYHYLIAKLLNAYLHRHGPENPPNYALRQDAYGLVSGAAAEFYRRNLVNYEDLKIALNGDVYGQPTMPEVRPPSEAGTRN